MMYVSRFKPDPSRHGEFLAGLWQGPVPEDLHLHSWLYVDADPREMVLIWEGEEAAREWVDQAFGEFGALSTETVTDSTPGLAACLDRDLTGFGEWLRQRGSDDAEIAHQLDVRRRGLEAETREQAVRAGQQWGLGGQGR